MRVLVPLQFDLACRAHGRNLRVIHLLGQLSRSCEITVAAASPEVARSAADALPDIRVLTAPESLACHNIRAAELPGPWWVRKAADFFGYDPVFHAWANRLGRGADVVLGFDTVEEYRANPALHLSATIGRVAGRIRDARFTLDGRVVQLPANHGRHHLHGGSETPFDQVDWAAEALATAAGPSVRFSRVSPDGEEGYPGEVSVSVTYTLTPANELRIDYLATTDRTTPLSLTNHSYFNLAGQGNGDILNHSIQIMSEKTTPVDATLIPTGELKDVAGTPFDFTAPHVIGERINDAKDEQIKFGGGYDHNFAVDGTMGTLRPAARVTEPASGRVMEVHTTQPGVQFYTGNFLDGTLTGKGGKVYQKRYGFCLETQHYPDSPNKPAFPTTTLKPGETHTSTTVYRFSVAQ